MINLKKSKEAILSLEARFIDGEQLTIDEIIKENFKVDNISSYLQSKKIVKGWVQVLKRRINKDYDLWFGNIDDQGKYGCNTLSEANYQYAMSRYYAFTKGILTRAISLRKEAVQKGFLLDSREVPVMLPRPPQAKEE